MRRRALQRLRALLLDEGGMMATLLDAAIRDSARRSRWRRARRSSPPRARAPRAPGRSTNWWSRRSTRATCCTTASRASCGAGRGPRPAGRRSAVRDRPGPPGRPRRHGGRGRARRHDHARCARPGRRGAGAGRRGLGGRRARGRVGRERGARARQGSRLRRRPGSDRGDAHKRREPLRRRPESRLDIVRRRCQTSTQSTSPSTPPTAGSPVPSRARRFRDDGS